MAACCHLTFRLYIHFLLHHFYLYKLLFYIPKIFLLGYYDLMFCDTEFDSASITLILSV